jgi:hypothetical protein
MMKQPAEMCGCGCNVDGVSCLTLLSASAVVNAVFMFIGQQCYDQSVVLGSALVADTSSKQAQLCFWPSMLGAVRCGVTAAVVNDKTTTLTLSGESMH